MSFENPATRLAALGLAGSLAVLSCTPQSPSDPEQTLGAIRVEVSTSGSGAPASFSVTLDGGSARSIPPNGTTTFGSLTPGGYAVQLFVPPNCTLAGSASRSVTVRESITSDVAFSVTCTAVPTGAIGVTTVTTGDSPDPDGYSLTVDGAPGPSVGTNATALLPDLTVGDHQIGLTGLAANCAVQDANPRTVPVTENQTTQVEFEIVCSSTTGQIEVSVTTTGEEVDPNGYGVSVDGGPEQTLGVNGTTTFAGLSPGPHDVDLTGVAANCAVAGDDPRSVDVTAGQTTSTTFEVTCSSTVGAIEVSVTTTGDAIDADGYSVVLDGGADTQLVDPNDVITFGGLAPGEHTLALQNVADNCTVTSDNPAIADVAAGQTAQAAFNVVCEALTGDIQVNVTTTGSDPDPNGYQVAVDGGTPLSIGINGSRTFQDEVIGEHDVEITGVAANCAVQGSNPRTVTVNQDQITQVNFSVACSSTTGQIQVTVTTTGDDLDPDGYTVDLDGSSSRSVATNGSTTFTGVAPGSHTLTLANAADNCTVTSSNPVNTTVTAGSTTNVGFSVDCTRLTGDIHVFTSSSGSPADANGYQVSVDGGAPRAIGINDQELFTDLQTGSHTVTLSDVALQCTVSGSTTRNVSVSADQETQVTFTVTCDPLEGDIQVNVSTSGTDLDPNGYTVLLDGGSSRSVGVNGSTNYTNVATGNHQISLTGLATNCSASGTNPRSVTVVDELTSTVNFSVTCTETEGSIAVDVATSGVDQDSDGYTITLDAGTPRSVGPDGSTTYLDLTPGDYDVGIDVSTVASNCTVNETNPQTANVTAGNTTNVSFTVSCTQLTGDLRVITSTSGADPDPDGYTVTVDGGMATTIGVNDTITFQDVPDGNRSVQLTGDADNCTVSNPNPRNVNVPANGTGSTTFSVTCTETEGSIAVDVTTSGDDPDPDGYTITLDAGTPRSVGPDGSTTYLDLTPGDYDVGIDVSTVASNCTVNETNPQTAGVTAGNTTNVSFTVSCTGLTGDLDVTTSTTGDPLDLDPDGYTIEVDGGTETMSIGVNGTISFLNLADGNHEVGLTGNASNCTVSGNNPRTVSVPADGTGSTTFNVDCAPTTGAIEVTATTNTGTPDADGYLVSVDAGTDEFIDDVTTVVFDGLSEGSHDVLLSGLGSCSVSSPSNPAAPTVVAGDTVSVAFGVTCP